MTIEQEMQEAMAKFMLDLNNQLIEMDLDQVKWSPHNQFEEAYSTIESDEEGVTATYHYPALNGAVIHADESLKYSCAYVHGHNKLIFYPDGSDLCSSEWESPPEVMIKVIKVQRNRKERLK